MPGLKTPGFMRNMHWPSLLPFAFIAALLVLYPRSSVSLGQAIVGNNPYALLSWLPLAWLIALALAINLERPAVKASTAAAVLMSAVCGLILLIGPLDGGSLWWFGRGDLTVFALHGLAMLTAMYGLPALFEQRWLVMFGLLAVPATGARVSAFILDMMTQGTIRIADMTGEMWGLHSYGDGLFEDSKGALYSVTSACAGVEGVTILAVLLPLLVLSRDRKRAGIWWLITAAVAWVGNIFRVQLLLAGHTWDKNTWQSVHSWGGTLILIGVCGILVWQLQRIGWRTIQWRAFPGQIPPPAPTHKAIGVALAILLIIGGASLALQISQPDGLQPGQADKASVVIEDSKLVWELDGWHTRLDNSLDWFDQWYGHGSISGSYTLWQDVNKPVYVQQVVTPDVSALMKYNELNCFVTHGSRIYDVQRMPWHGGTATLVRQYRPGGNYYVTMSWIQPVEDDEGQTWYRRMIIYVDAGPGGGKDDVPRNDGDIRYRLRELVLPVDVEPGKARRDWSAAEDLAIAAAKDIVDQK